MAATADGNNNNPNSGITDEEAVPTVYYAVISNQSINILRPIIFKSTAAAINAPGRNAETHAAETPIEAARRLGRDDLVFLLIMHGADPWVLRNGTSLDLIECILGGQVDRLRDLLEQGALDGNAPVFPGTPPFFAAVHACVDVSLQFRLRQLWRLTQPPVSACVPRLDVLETLVLEGGADVNARDAQGRTVLHLLGRDPAALQRVLALGADVHAVDDEGRTPVFRYVQIGAVDAMWLLLDRGASVDVVDVRGFNPLMVACGTGKAALVAELATRSSDATRRAVADMYGDEGFSALDMLLDANRPDEDAEEEEEEQQQQQQPENEDGEGAQPRRFGSLAPWMVGAMANFAASRAPMRLEHSSLAVDYVLWHVEQLRQEQQQVPAWAPGLLHGLMLTRGGVAVDRALALRAMPIVAAHRAAAEWDARRSRSRRWMALDDVVQLAFDFVELREVEEAVRRLEARLVELAGRAAEELDEADARAEALEEELAALKAELRAAIERVRGVGQEEDTEMEEEDDEDEMEEEEGAEASAGGAAEGDGDDDKPAA